MNRSVLIVLTVFSILGSLLFCGFFSRLVYVVVNYPDSIYWSLGVYCGLALLPFFLPALLAAVSGIYTLSTTRGFMLWNAELPRKARNIAFTGWISGGVTWMLLICLLIAWIQE